MSKNKIKLPDWYWSRGLHDAKILSVSKKEVGWDPSDNSLIFKIDGDGAMFEQDITEIRFYNFKILSNNFSLEGLQNGWWLSDELSMKGDTFYLDLCYDTENCKTKRLEFCFKKAEVIRDNK